MCDLMQTVPPLEPTLWRTCRVLANATRLRVLNEVVKTPDLDVTRLARRLGLSQPQATQHLRLLQSRGLLHVQRRGRHAFYRGTAEPSVVHADPLLAAARAALDREDLIADMVRAFTAFTHERRILVYRALQAGCKQRGELAVRTGISPPALKRHLRKLSSRGLIALSRSEVQPCVLPPGLLRDLAVIASPQAPPAA
jgi:ArsR family transcriptional regulator